MIHRPGCTRFLRLLRGRQLQPKMLKVLVEYGCMKQYWLCILNRENWKIVQDRRIWGVADRHKRAIEEVKVGDELLFYTIGQTIGKQRLESAIVGRAEVASGVLRDTRKIFSTGPLKRSTEAFPLRIKLSNLRSAEKEVLFKPLISILELTRNKRKWGGVIQGKAMRKISENDFKTIIECIG